MFLITTTGVIGTASFPDLGDRTITHPTNLDLEIEYPIFELLESKDLQSAIDNNYITVSDGITNITDLTNFYTSVYVHNNTKFVRDISDFPPPTGNIIELNVNKVYDIIGTVNIGTYSLKLNNGTSVIGTSNVTDHIHYSGTGSAFIINNSDVSIIDLHLEAQFGKLFEIDNILSNRTLIKNSIIQNTKDLGTVNNCNIFELDNLIIESYNGNGFVMGGTQNGRLLLHDISAKQVSNTFINLASSIWEMISIDRCNINIDNNSIFIAGLTSNGNLNTNGFSIVSGNNFIGTSVSILSNINSNDTKWEFSGNNGISNSETNAELFMNGNTVITLIPEFGVATKILGTTTADILERFTHSGSNRLTYIGERSVIRVINISLTFTAFGDNDIMAFYIGVNGSIINKSKSSIRTSLATDRQFITCTTLMNLSKNDYIEAFVINETSTTDISVIDMNMTIK